ncbi:hypothetical protein [Agrococcus jejuensis]|nr:hypothetical protein [Agrococcus jejuensis]
MMSSLRAELGASDPEFVLQLPDGWVRMDASDDSRDALLQQARERLMRAHRPELYARMRQSLLEAFEQLQRAGGAAVILPIGDVEGYVPASLSAAFRSGSGGEGLDAAVAGLIADGGTPLGDDRRFVRREARDETVQDGQRLGITTVHYLTPVPRTNRSRMLVLTAVMPHPVDVPDDEPLLVATRFLMDAMVATLRWRRPAGASA